MAFLPFPGKLGIADLYKLRVRWEWTSINIIIINVTFECLRQYYEDEIKKDVAIYNTVIYNVIMQYNSSSQPHIIVWFRRSFKHTNNSPKIQNLNSLFDVLL